MFPPCLMARFLAPVTYTEACTKHSNWQPDCNPPTIVNFASLGHQLTATLGEGEGKAQGSSNAQMPCGDSVTDPKRATCCGDNSVQAPHGRGS